MAEFIGGSEEGFVELMNQRAAQLGMSDTTFVNACGLDADGHMTSANDIAIMSRELINNYPQVKEYTTTWQDSIVHKTKKGESEFGLTNTNKLLKWYDGATGLKTGSTGKALYCLSGTAEKNGLELVGVVMAAPDFKVRFQEVMKLFDYGFANYEMTSCDADGTELGELSVHNGSEETVKIITKGEVSFLSPKGSEIEVVRNENLPGAISAPFEAGTKVGDVVYSVNGDEVGRVDAVAAVSMDKIKLGEMMERLLKKWCG